MASQAQQQQQQLANLVDESRKITIFRGVTSSLSIIASAMIIVMLARSTKKFTTTLHRLLLGLSISDLIGSFAQLLGSIPMPKETIYSDMARGNDTTCHVQGFIILATALLTPAYNACICIFYTLKVLHGMDDDQIMWRAEPFFHLVSLFISLLIPTSAYLKKYINAGPAMCYMSQYPLECSSRGFPCVRGEDLYSSWEFIMICIMLYIIYPALVITSMTRIYLKVRKQHEAMARYGRGSLSSTSSRMSAAGAYNVKMTLYRALAYSGAWMVSFFFLVVVGVMRLFNEHRPSFALRTLVSFFHPLQGFFNLIVFLYPKVVEARRLNPGISLREAIIMALQSSRGEPTDFRRPVERRAPPASMIVRDLEGVGTRNVEDDEEEEQLEGINEEEEVSDGR